MMIDDDDGFPRNAPNMLLNFFFTKIHSFSTESNSLRFIKKFTYKQIICCSQLVTFS